MVDSPSGDSKSYRIFRRRNGRGKSDGERAGKAKVFPMTPTPKAPPKSDDGDTGVRPVRTRPPEGTDDGG